MTSELFPLASVSVKSPRLRWMDKHDVSARFRNDLPGDFPDRWEAYVGRYEDAVQYSFEHSDHSDDCPIDNKRMVALSDKDNALIKLARNNNWKTWLEEGWENE